MRKLYWMTAVMSLFIVNACFNLDAGVAGEEESSSSEILLSSEGESSSGLLSSFENNLSSETFSSSEQSIGSSSSFALSSSAMSSSGNASSSSNQAFVDTTVVLSGTFTEANMTGADIFFTIGVISGVEYKVTVWDAFYSTAAGQNFIGDVELSIYDVDGNLLITSSDESENLITFSTAGAVILKFSNYSGAEPGDFAFQVD